MKFPTHLDLIVPTIKALKEMGGTATPSEITNKVIELEGYSEEIQTEAQKGDGYRTKLEYRLAWARTYMKKFLKREPPMSFSQWEVFSLIFDIKFNKDKKYNASYLQIPKSYLGYKLISEKLLDYCKKNGIKVHAWTINERNEMNKLIGMGVDGIMTDNCRTLLDVVRKYKFFDKKIVLHPFLNTQMS